MTQFDQRERAFEKKFGLDEEAEFKIAVHAAKLFGQWAAEKLGLQGPDAEAYAEEVAEIAVTKPDHGSVIAKAESDLKAKEIIFSHQHLEKEMNDCDTVARAASRKP